MILNFEIFFYGYECFDCVYVCTSHSRSALWEPEDGVRSLVVNLQMGASCHVNAGNQTLVLFKCSETLSHVYRPKIAL